MLLVVGLGNPGRRYTRSRHNAGWRVVERLVAEWGARAGESDERYESWRAERGGREVGLVKPLTYMNLSGEAVEAWRQRHGLETGAMLVVSDDVYLPIGTIRVRARGSSGGHRGLESIEAALGTNDYARLRIGVGAVDASELRDHVLQAPSGDDDQRLEASIEQAADAVACWVAEGIDAAMNRFNRRPGKEVSES